MGRRELENTFSTFFVLSKSVVEVFTFIAVIELLLIEHFNRHFIYLLIFRVTNRSNDSITDRRPETKTQLRLRSTFVAANNILRNFNSE